MYKLLVVNFCRNNMFQHYKILFNIYIIFKLVYMNEMSNLPSVKKQTNKLINWAELNICKIEKG